MTMKIFKLFLSAAVMVSLAAGCARELEPAHAELNKSVSYTATLDETPTKTVLDYEKKLSLWTGDEYISVLNGQENYTFMSTSQEPSVTATFFLAEEKDYIPSDVVAMYPCRAEYALDKESMTVSGVYVPTSQKMNPETYDVNASILMAYAEGNELKFKNAMTLLRFKVKDSGVYSVTIKSNGGEGLTGGYDLKWNDGSPLFAPVEAVDSVNLCVNGDFEPGKYYYAAVVPGNYPQGFTVTMNTGGESRVISDAKTLERNTIYDLGEFALPAAVSWGITGTMNAWGDLQKDYILEEEGEWLVYQNLPISIMDCFKFRADNEWVSERSFGGILSADEYVFAEGERGNMYIWEPGLYDIYLAKNLESFKFEKVGDLENKPEAKNWGVVGTMTGWGNDYVMTAEGNIYVARNIPIRATDEFKFRVDGAWDYNLGSPQLIEGEVSLPVTSVYPAYLAVGGRNITVAESGLYDIFLSCYEDGFRIIKVDDLEEEEPQPDPDPVPGESIYGIVGTLNGWDAPDVNMGDAGDGMYVAKNVVFDKDENKFKIRANEEWNDEANFGLKAAGPIEKDKGYPVISSGGSGDMTIASGTYDIWFDLTNMMVYAMTPGKHPKDAGTEMPKYGEWIYVPGNHQGWSPDKAPALRSENKDGVYTGFVNFNGDFKFTHARDWNNGEYNKDHFETYPEGFSKSNDGTNITAPAKYCYVVVNVPEKKIEATPVVWGIIGSATAGGWDTDQDMTWDAKKACWTATVDFAAGDWKFRANDGWDINLGGAEGDLTAGGANINVAEAGTYAVELYTERTTSDKVYCTVTKQ